MRPMKSRWAVVMLLVLLSASLSLGSWIASACAESEGVSPSEFGALKDVLESINTSLEDIKKELQLMRELLSQRPPQPTRPADVMATVSLSGRPMLGRPDAPLTLVEFSDYQCPYCRRFFDTTLPALKAEYIDTGKLRYVFRDFPIDRIHPFARKAAEAAHCAGDQGRYWEMHDRLFQNHKALQVEQLKAHAQALGLDPGAFDACLEQGKYAAQVQRDLEDGAAAGVQGTPGFFLGKTRPEDTIQGMFIKGAQPVTAFRSVIERLLTEKEK
jgi:protein-disulfide isomerase